MIKEKSWKIKTSSSNNLFTNKHVQYTFKQFAQSPTGINEAQSQCSRAPHVFEGEVKGTSYGFLFHQ